MELKNFKTQKQLLKALEITEQDLQKALSLPYRKGVINKNGKDRRLEKPNQTLKMILGKNLVELQKIEPPEYCQCGFKGQNNIKNAQKHLNQREIITLDVHACFQNSKDIYVRKFFEDKLNITGEALEIMLQLTTYRGYLPTGAPTSPVLLFLSHQEIFDKISKHMKRQGITMTLYMDDITLSAKRHISGKAVKYVEKTLSEHELRLNHDKIKRFGRDIGFVTGVAIKPSGKLEVPYKINYSVIEMLESKKIKDMKIKELQKLLGTVNYIQQITPNRYQGVRRMATKRLYKLLKDYQKPTYE